MLPVNIFLLCSLWFGYLTAAATQERIPLVIFGVDGFGYEAYKQYGNKSSGDTNIFPIETVFPSKTFPNFMSLATGLHPTQHGIISNSFYNPKRNKSFKYEDGQDTDFDWYKGEPIWITVKKRNLRSYVDMWVGSSAVYQGMTPDIVFAYNGSKTLEEKVDGILKNMDSDEKCDLYMLYINQPDYTLHKSDYSDTAKMQDVFNKAEQSIAFLKSSLGDRKYNLIVTSDHGMAGYYRKYELPKDLRNKASRFYGGPTAMWYSENATNVEDEVDEINQYLVDSDMMGVKARAVSNLDKRFQLCGMKGEGVPDIVMMMEDDVAIGVFSQLSGHGYDNSYKKMFAHVRVSGPAFKEVPDVENNPVIMNTEMYNLYCSLLDIKPANNTGSLDTFDFLLVSPPNRTAWEDNYHKIPAPCSGTTRLHTTLTFLIVFSTAVLPSWIRY